MKTARLEEAMKGLGHGDQVEKIDKEVPKQQNAGSSASGSIIPRTNAATTVLATTKATTQGVSVARAPFSGLAQSLVASAAANAVRLAGAQRNVAPGMRRPGEKVNLEVPEGAEPGTQLTVQTSSGQEVTMTVPEGAEPGQQLEVEVPAQPQPAEETVVLEVPEGAEPGTQLTVTGPSGQQVTLTVPEGVEAGQQLELSLIHI